MLSRFALVLTLASAAYAGVNGTTILNYSIANNTGATANDLNVETEGVFPAPVTFSPFTTASPFIESVDFSGGAGVPSLGVATFTLEGSGPNDAFNPAVESYCWAVGCDPTSSPNYNPIFFSFDDGTTLQIGTNSGTDSFTGLYVTQDGNHLYTGSTTGTVGASDMAVASGINFANGPLDFGLTDTTDGVTINGSFTATPEPATTGLCALMFVGMVVAIRRRQLRRQ